MNRSRLFIVLIGPPAIVAASMALSWSLRPTAETSPQRNHVLASVGSGGEIFAATSSDSAPPRPNVTSEALDAACREAASRWEARLGQNCRVLAAPPFVVAGDTSRDELARWHDKTIGPASHAMAKSYFDIPPDKPISILLFSSEDSYNHYTKQLFGDEGISVYGYYKPAERTLVMNIATGGGTLVHELTHALIDFDFPGVPDWFNEGLASLHEQCRIRSDESAIDGLVNWRLAGLQDTIRTGRLRSLEALIRDDDFRGAGVGLNYAQARYFCLYLQEQGRLTTLYDRLRDGQPTDPTGLKAVASLFPNQAWSEVDQAFQKWVLALRRPL